MGTLATLALFVARFFPANISSDYLSLAPVAAIGHLIFTLAGD